MANARDILLNLLGKETVSPAAKRAGNALEDMGDDAKTTAKRVAQLDHEADELKRSLAGLAAAWTAAGSAAERAELGKQIRVDQGKLRQALNMRKLMAGAGEDAAGGLVAGLVARIGPLVVAKLPGAINPAVAAVAAGPAAVLATTMGTALGGAIIGGAAGVGIVGGLAVAAKHSAVQAAAKSLGAEVSRSLQIDAAAFVPAAQEAIGILRTEFEKARGDIADIFSATSGYVRPLTQAVGTAFRDVLSGIRDLAVRAGPVIDSIATGIVRIGRAVKEGLTPLADNANEGGRALGVFFLIVEAGTRGIFRLIDGLAELYGWMEKIGGAMRGDFSPVFRDAYEDQLKAAEGSSALAEELKALMAGFSQTGAAAGAAGQQFQSWADKMRALQDQTIAQMNSEIAYQQAIDDATAARRENGKTLDINTQKGRDNMTALLGIASAARQNAEDIRNLTGSEDLATQAMDRARRAFIDQAVAMGMSRQKAADLATQLFGLPNVKRTVTVVTAEAEKNLKDIAALIRAIKSKRVVITVDRRGRQTTRSDGRNVGIGDGIGGREYGGPVKAGHAYVVGEKRPEVFVPDRDGRIIPSVEKYNSMTGRANQGAGIDYDRLSRAVARALSGAVFRIDDRTARLVDLYARGG